MVNFYVSLDNIQNLGSQYLAYFENDKTYFDFGQELMSITSKELKDFLNQLSLKYRDYRLLSSLISDYCYNRDTKTKKEY